MLLGPDRASASPLPNSLPCPTASLAPVGCMEPSICTFRAVGQEEGGGGSSSINHRPPNVIGLFPPTWMAYRRSLLTSVQIFWHSHI